MFKQQCHRIRQLNPNCRCKWSQFCWSELIWIRPGPDQHLGDLCMTAQNGAYKGAFIIQIRAESNQVFYGPDMARLGGQFQQSHSFIASKTNEIDAVLLKEFQQFNISVADRVKARLQNLRSLRPTGEERFYRFNLIVKHSNF